MTDRVLYPPEQVKIALLRAEVGPKRPLQIFFTNFKFDFSKPAPARICELLNRLDLGPYGDACEARSTEHLVVDFGGGIPGLNGAVGPRPKKKVRNSGFFGGPWTFPARCLSNPSFEVLCWVAATLAHRLNPKCR